MDMKKWINSQDTVQSGCLFEVNAHCFLYAQLTVGYDVSGCINMCERYLGIAIPSFRLQAGGAEREARGNATL